MATLFKRIILILVSAAALLGLLYLAQRILMPKYVNELKDGALIREYYKQNEKHDIIFIGDCEAYTGFIPSVLKEEYGLSSFVRGSAAQRIWQSYYLLAETFEYETPGAVVFSVYGAVHDKVEKEEYNRLLFDGMKNSKYKYAAIRESMTEGESLISYVFPLLRYHSRWNRLTKDDLKYAFDTPLISDNGYLGHEEVKAAEYIPEPKPLSDYSLPDVSMEYLEKMYELCKKHDTQLILVKTPVLYPYWYPEWDAQIKEFADSKGITYYNYLERIDEIGLDFTKDTYDGGQHLNDSGAGKLTRYFGDQMINGDRLGFSAFLDGITLKPGEVFDKEAVKNELLGTFTDDSCAFDASDIIYSYADFVVTVSEEGIIREVRFTTDKYKTAEGISLGMGEKDVEERYKDIKKENGEMLLKKGDTELVFVLDKDEIISIEYRSAL